jgi:hypothetical protein
MSVTNVAPNIGEMLTVRTTDRPAAGSTDYRGPSFAESMKGVAQAANIQVADGSGAARLGLRRERQEKLEKLFSFSEAEEGFIEEAVACISKLLDLLKK